MLEGSKLKAYSQKLKTINYQLSIVSFDIPYPADYGGVIDVFYKIKTLSELGIKITLHCFEYGDRKPQKVLEKYCYKVFYYKRKRNIFQQLTLTPFIVYSRKNKKLLENLCLDNAPILFEGLHTCGFISHPKLAARKKFVRMHNIEWQYYSNLAVSENNIFKSLFFKIESWRLKLFENKIISSTQKIFFISPDDEKYFMDKYKNESPESEVIFPFHNYELNLSNFVTEHRFFLFHGNLSVPENENAVRALVENIFSKGFVHNIPLIVAGKSPSTAFKNYFKKFANVSLVENPSEKYLQALSQQATAHILYVEKPAGIKLKLIRSLAENKNVFVHRNMLPDSSWSQYCTVFNSCEDLQYKISNLNLVVENSSVINLRKKLFETILNNELNAQKIIASLKE